MSGNNNYYYDCSDKSYSLFCVQSIAKSSTISAFFAIDFAHAAAD